MEQDSARSNILPKAIIAWFGTCFVLGIAGYLSMKWIDNTWQGVPSEQAVAERIGKLGGTYTFGQNDGRTRSGRTITIVSLNDSAVTDTDLPEICSFPNLRELYLERTRITDAGMPHLLEARQLERLSLKETKVGNLSVQKLSGMSRLFALDVNQTNVTLDVYETVMRTLPAIRKLMKGTASRADCASP